MLATNQRNNFLYLSHAIKPRQINEQHVLAIEFLLFAGHF